MHSIFQRAVWIIGKNGETLEMMLNLEVSIINYLSLIRIDGMRAYYYLLGYDLIKGSIAEKLASQIADTTNLTKSEALDQGYYAVSKVNKHTYSSSTMTAYCRDDIR